MSLETSESLEASAAGLELEAVGPAALEPDEQRDGLLASLGTIRRSPRALTGVILLVLLVGFSVVAPLFTPSPITQDLGARLLPPAWSGGTSRHLLGTDSLGRDVLARLAGGVQISLIIVVLSVAIALVLGTIIGLVAGYYGGWFDAGVMRLADIQLAFPDILLILLVVSTLGAGVGTLIATLAIAGWVLYARVVRSQTMAVKHKEYIESAHSIGSSGGRTLFRHILPNISGQIIVIASFAAANIVLIESALSYLGLGVPPPRPSLGGMISDGQAYLSTDPWLSVVPGVAIFVIVVAVNLIGDWLRQILDPRDTLRRGRR
jgi:peptide/nickel transport system permease protein